MKISYFLTAFVLAALLGACQTEEEIGFYDQPYVNAQIKFLYKPVDYKCEVSFEGNTYRLTSVSGQDDIAIPLASLDADTTRRAPLVVQPLDREERPNGDPSILMTTLKADTTIQILKPVNDTVQFYDTERHFTVPLSCKFIPYRYGGNYNNHGITINGDKLPEFVNNGIYFTRGNEKDKTIAFYERDPEKAAVTQYDPETQEPIAVIEHYDFEEGKPLEYIHPLGGVPTLYTGEDQFPKASIEVKWTQNDAKYIFEFQGEPVKWGASTPFYVANEEMLSGELVCKRSIQEGDTVEYYREHVTFKNGENLVLNDFGDGTLSNNEEYTGEDPDDRQSMFIRINLPAECVAGGHFDEETGQWVDDVYTGNYDIKIYTAHNCWMGYESDKRKLIAELKDVAGGTAFTDPVQIHLRGDVFAPDVWDSYVESGEVFYQFTPDWSDEAPDFHEVCNAVVLEIFMAGTDTRVFESASRPLNMLDGQAFAVNMVLSDDQAGMYLPCDFVYKCYYIQVNRWNANVMMSQGEWEDTTE